LRRPIVRIILSTTSTSTSSIGKLKLLLNQLISFGQVSTTNIKVSSFIINVILIVLVYHSTRMRMNLKIPITMSNLNWKYT